MAANTTSASKSSGSNVADDKILYIFAYFLTFISGIICLVIAPNNKRLRLHSFQAIILGVIMIIVAVIGAVTFFFGFIFSLINLLIWLYGLYVGYKAYMGEDMTIPVVTDLAKGFAK